MARIHHGMDLVELETFICFYASKHRIKLANISLNLRLTSLALKASVGEHDEATICFMTCHRVSQSDDEIVKSNFARTTEAGKRRSIAPSTMYYATKKGTRRTTRSR
eukprot:758180-Hanusia_phi.AAC.1